MTTRARVRLAVATFAVAVAIYYPFSPGGRQRQNIRRADDHVALLKPKLASDARFTEVRLSVTTARRGCILILGEVPTRADAEALRSIVTESDPPVEVIYTIRAMEGAATRPQG